MSRDGPGTAQYGGVWPNEWPNGSVAHETGEWQVGPASVAIAVRLHQGGASPTRQ